MPGHETQLRGRGGVRPSPVSPGSKRAGYGPDHSLLRRADARSLNEGLCRKQLGDVPRALVGAPLAAPGGRPSPSDVATDVAAQPPYGPRASSVQGAASSAPTNARGL